MNIEYTTKWKTTQGDKAFFILYTTMAQELDPKLEKNILSGSFKKWEFAFPSQLLLAS